MKYVSDLKVGDVIVVVDNDTAETVELVVDGFDRYDELPYLGEDQVHVYAFRVDNGEDSSFDADDDEEVVVK